VIDAAVADHLEVLGLVPLVRLRIVERVRHADAVQRLLQHAVDQGRRGQLRGFENGRRDVDHVMELRADLALRLDAVGPVDDRAVAGAAEMRCDLLGPLVRRVHRVRPADGVVVLRARRAQLVDALDHQLGRGEIGRLGAGLVVPGADQRAFGRSAVVADEVVDERVVQDPQLGERIDDPADVMVGVLEERRVDLHLAREHGAQPRIHLLPRRNVLRALGQLALRAG
jgi:hypothetical protein